MWALHSLVKWHRALIDRHPLRSCSVQVTMVHHDRCDSTWNDFIINMSVLTQASTE